MVSASRGGGGVGVEVEVVSESTEFCMFQLLSSSNSPIHQFTNSIDNNHSGQTCCHTIHVVMKS